MKTQKLNGYFISKGQSPINSKYVEHIEIDFKNNRLVYNFISKNQIIWKFSNNEDLTECLSILFQDPIEMKLNLFEDKLPEYFKLFFDLMEEYNTPPNPPSFYDPQTEA